MFKSEIYRVIHMMNLIRYDSFCFMNIARNYAVLHKIDYKRCYELLELSQESDQDEIRSAYLRLVKKYHPDSGSEDASVEKFQEIDEAFKILTTKISKERLSAQEKTIEEQDVKHTAPQHRQYLSYEGYGMGTPFQREKQYSKLRAIKASQNVFQHRVEKATAEEHALMKKKSLKHDIKTKYGVERLVEDLIQESMSKGEFTKLSGAGKPLKDSLNHNPFVDLITHKLNEVLIDNGFTPEWIMLNKEIREDVSKLRTKLLEERSYFKENPLNEEDSAKWRECVSKYKCFTKDINVKIDKFNLVVPIMDKQLFHIDLDREAERILLNGKHCSEKDEFEVEKTEIVNSRNSDLSLFGFIEKFFK